MEKQSPQNPKINLVECPRDALQGLRQWVPTARKVEYLQQLLRVGFPVLDCGSFVSPKAIPPMADTSEVLNALDRKGTSTKLLTIVANRRGAEEACDHPEVDVLGYPLSISENFQMRNTHKTIADSEILLEEIIALTAAYGKELVVYLSMGFGNPYGDPWSPELVLGWIEKLTYKGVTCISLSDTVGMASSELITKLLSKIKPDQLEIVLGVHLHTAPQDSYAKIDAAFHAGCRRIDGALLGYGGCPMAHDDLIGNMPTEHLYSYCNQHRIPHGLNGLQLESALNIARKIFDSYRD